MSEMIAIAAYKIQSPIEAPFRALQNWIRANKTKRVLNGLGNAQLEDIGLSRQDISRVAARKFR